MINWQNGTTPINATNMNKLVQEDMITNVYSSSSTYAVGDYCIYGNTLYRCTTAISTAEAWNSAKWALVNIADEIKNSMELYSTTERKIGTWIDGKPLYRKVINFGALPNNELKTVNHNIVNGKFIKIENSFMNNSNDSGGTIPYAVTNGSLRYWITDTRIEVYSSVDRSGFNCFFILEYTKTTD